MGKSIASLRWEQTRKDRKRPSNVSRKKWSEIKLRTVIKSK